MDRGRLAHRQFFSCQAQFLAPGPEESSNNPSSHQINHPIQNVFKWRKLKKIKVFLVVSKKECNFAAAITGDKPIFNNLSFKDKKKNMIIVPVKDGENIERALKKFKRKFEKTGVVKELRRRQQYDKPSVLKRLKMERAIYVQKLRQTEEKKKCAKSCGIQINSVYSLPNTNPNDERQRNTRYCTFFRIFAA